MNIIYEKLSKSNLIEQNLIFPQQNFIQSPRSRILLNLKEEDRCIHSGAIPFLYWSLQDEMEMFKLFHKTDKNDISYLRFHPNLQCVVDIWKVFIFVQILIVAEESLESAAATFYLYAQFLTKLYRGCLKYKFNWFC